MFYKGKKEQIDEYNNLVSVGMGLINDDKWGNPQECIDGNWVILKHPSFIHHSMIEISNPDFKI